MPSCSPYLLYMPLVERWPHDPAAWLTAGEQGELAMLSDAGRRRQWLAGRWAGKQLLSISVVCNRLADLEIRSRDAQGRGDRPRIYLAGKPLGCSLSIAHTGRGVMAALAIGKWDSIGIDLVDLADSGWANWRTSGAAARFSQLWFTPVERHWIASDPARRSAAIWAVKEAVYKAAQRGESWSPRQISVRPRRIASIFGGFRCFYRGRPMAGLDVQLQEIDGHLAARATVAAARPIGRRPRFITNSLEHELILRQAS